ncbi:MotA/TolQ/ExbB proton channel family protein [Chimaeribacter arupi]|uniref:MotA/TolQ/ExbB proton channel family protein n=1 Tax=Chimaeribacter arupi TaxID=2060066 RepID=UPI0011AFA939|nr:MotA/TolQ/ExbB proton channel family protein [Chimaeribacter arupi]
MNRNKTSSRVINNNLSLFMVLLVAAAPLFMMLVPGIRHYVIDTYNVAAFYNTVVILVYTVGCAIVIASFFEIRICNGVLKTKDYVKTAHLLGDANKIVFKPDHGLDDDTLMSLYENIDESVNRKHNQRMSAILSCANISTMIGLLGTFAGLSLTIASVITLLDKSQIGGGTDADTLKIIVNVVSSLSEPLRGMNTAFVSSIYGVVSAILLNVMSSLVRNAFVRLNVTLRDTKLSFIREMKRKQVAGKTRTLRIVSPVDEIVSDIKASLATFQERLITLCTESNGTVRQLLEQATVNSAQRAAFEASLLSFCETGSGRLRDINNGVEKVKEGLSEQQNVINDTHQQIAEHTALLVKTSEQMTEQEAKIAYVTDSQQAIEQSQAVVLHNSQQLQNAMKELHDNTVGEFEKNHQQLNAMDAHIILHEQQNLVRHSTTQSHIESHLKTFTPLFGQIADMHHSLQKDVLILKEKNDQ